jgi:hypothetical protein
VLIEVIALRTLKLMGTVGTELLMQCGKEWRSIYIVWMLEWF